MSTDQHMRITLPRAMAEAVRSKVASGEYATESDVALAGLRLLLDSESSFDDWLRTDVAAAHDRLNADPSRALGVDVVRSRLAGRRKPIPVKR